jgi:hypothetical protein
MLALVDVNKINVAKGLTGNLLLIMIPTPLPFEISTLLFI